MKKSNAPAGARTPFQKWVDKYQGLFYLIPWIIGFLVFKAFPFGQSLYYSFTDMNFFKDGTSFVGLANYITAFHTRKITKALIITFKYAFITVPLKLIFALFIAYILNFKIACVNLFRTVYYIPSILGGSVAIAVLWKAVFSVDGLLNTVVRAVTFGAVQGPEWLSDPNYALWIICFLRIWQFGSAMVLFLAALKGVPADLYEAATIDGSGEYSTLFRVVIPIAKPGLATVALLNALAYWNDWFTALIYLRADQAPLPLVLRNILIKSSTSASQSSMVTGGFAELNKLTEMIKFASIIVAAAPMLIVYPFVQKYFEKGFMAGAVKG